MSTLALSVRLDCVEHSPGNLKACFLASIAGNLADGTRKSKLIFGLYYFSQKLHSEFGQGQDVVRKNNFALRLSHRQFKKCLLQLFSVPKDGYRLDYDR